MENISNFKIIFIYLFIYLNKVILKFMTATSKSCVFCFKELLGLRSKRGVLNDPQRRSFAAAWEVSYYSFAVFTGFVSITLHSCCLHFISDPVLHTCMFLFTLAYHLTQSAYTINHNIKITCLWLYRSSFDTKTALTH